MVHFISWRMAWCMTRKAVNYKPTPTPRLEARGEENKSREITALVHFIYSSHSPFKTNHFVVGCQCAQRILPTQTKYFLELSIIVDFVVNNCLKNRELYICWLILFLRQFKSIWMSIIVNSRIIFVFALMKCSYAAFGEQNKIDNDRKCQLVNKSQ